MDINAAFNTPTIPQSELLNKNSIISITPPSYEKILEKFNIQYDELSKFEINEMEVTDAIKHMVNKIEHLGERIGKLNSEITESETKLTKLKEIRHSVELQTTSLTEMFRHSSFSASKKIDIESHIMDSTQYIISNLIEEQYSIETHLNKTLVAFDQLNETHTRLQSFLRSSIFASTSEKERASLCSNNTCSICITNNSNATYECGHVFCSECTTRCGLKCPNCRKTSTKIIKLFMESNKPVTNSDVQPYSMLENGAQL